LNICVFTKIVLQKKINKIKAQEKKPSFQRRTHWLFFKIKAESKRSIVKYNSKIQLEKKVKLAIPKPNTAGNQIFQKLIFIFSFLLTK